ncbi:MAG: hypothetical protein EBR09_04075 [Proteobacteria bacterium]|nr:hypothetical protein [Pseudomonadota bacterium]
MLTRSHFSVDLWFIFGSFCYGAEARLSSCRSDSLTVSISSATQQTISEVASFLESINEKAKALIRTEVRLFVNGNPDAPADDWADELVATLMTELKPRVTQGTNGQPEPLLIVELADIRGLTPNDQNAWNNLVADIWPRLPA